MQHTWQSFPATRFLVWPVVMLWAALVYAADLRFDYEEEWRRPVSVEVLGAPTSEVVEKIARDSGWRLNLASPLPGHVTAAVADAPVRGLLDRLLQPLGCNWLHRGKQLVVFDRRAFRAADREPAGWRDRLFPDSTWETPHVIPAGRGILVSPPKSSRGPLLTLRHHVFLRAIPASAVVTVAGRSPFTFSINGGLVRTAPFGRLQVNIRDALIQGDNVLAMSAMAEGDATPRLWVSLDYDFAQAAPIMRPPLPTDPQRLELVLTSRPVKSLLRRVLAADAGSSASAGAPVAERRLKLLSGKDEWGAVLLGGDETSVAQMRRRLIQSDPGLRRLRRPARTPTPATGRGLRSTTG